MTRNAAKPRAAGSEGADSSSAWHVAAEANRRLGHLLGKHWTKQRKLLEKKRRKNVLPCRWTAGCLGQGWCLFRVCPARRGVVAGLRGQLCVGTVHPAGGHCPGAEAPWASPLRSGPRAVAAGTRPVIWDTQTGWPGSPLYLGPRQEPGSCLTASSPELHPMSSN